VVVVAAAATGSVAALITSSPGSPAPGSVAGYPSSSAPAESSPGSRGGLPLGAGSASSQDRTGEAAAAAPNDPPGPPVMPVGTPYRGADWPALTYTLKAVTGGMSPAPFPRTVPGYVLEDSFTTRLDVVEAKRFIVFGDLPVKNVSYDQCRRQRFFVRWRSVDPTALVEATFVDAQVRTVQNHPVSGTSGWQSSFGCVQPAMRIRPPAGSRPDHTVVVAQMQVWVRR
jgi:hypothetical protein